MLTCAAAAFAWLVPLRTRKRATRRPNGSFTCRSSTTTTSPVRQRHGFAGLLDVPGSIRGATQLSREYRLDGHNRRPAGQRGTRTHLPSSQGFRRFIRRWRSRRLHQRRADPREPGHARNVLHHRRTRRDARDDDPRPGRRPGRAGHAIGNHTLDHDNLRKLDPTELRHQIEGAQQVLQQVLGYRPRTFAYPYGRFTDAVVQAVAESGFDLGFTVRAGAIESTSEPMLSKRIEVGPLDSGSQVLAKIAPFADPCPGPSPDLAISKNATDTFRGWKVESSTVVPQQTVRRMHVKAGHLYSYFVQLKDPSNTGAGYALRLDESQATGATSPSSRAA